MVSLEKDFYNFKLSFKGNLIENSVDAYDVANTIIATSNILQEIAEIKYGSDFSDKLKINIHAFREGSLNTDFIIHTVQDALNLAPALLPVASNIYIVGKDILNTFKTYIEIKKALKGEDPKSIQALSNNKFELKINGHNNIFVFNLDAKDLRVLQSKTIEKNTEKAVAPLKKPDSLIEEIDWVSDDINSVGVTKENASYLDSRESL